MIPNIFYITEKAWNYFPYTITEYTVSWHKLSVVHVCIILANLGVGLYPDNTPDAVINQKVGFTIQMSVSKDINF